MSAPLEAYLRQQRMGAMWGHPVVDDQMNGPAAAWWMWQRRRGQGGRMGDDELAALMGGADELGAEAMAELGAALADDDDDDDDDDDEALGASTEGLQDKLDDLKQKRAEAYGKYVSAKFGPTRKIREKKLKRLDKKIAKVKAKLLKRKAQDAAARGQAPGQPPGLARSQAPQGNGPLENVMIQDSQGRYVGIQRAGRLQPLSLYVGGQLDAVGNFPVSSVARSRVAASFQTDQITYASFYLRGFRVGAQMNPNTASAGSYSQNTCPMECQLRIVVTNLTVNGFTNLLYSPITVELGSTFGFSSNREVIEGLRSNSRLSQNNRISAEVYVENPFALSSTNRIDFGLTFEALVDTEFDDLYGAYPARSAA